LTFSRADHELAEEIGRWGVENNLLTELYPSANIFKSSSGEYRIRFTVDSRFNNSWNLYLDFGSNYPDERPHVKTDGWSIEESVGDEDFNHRYDSSTPCVQDPNQWSRDMSAALVIFKAAKWIDKYEMWLNSGSSGSRTWPGAQHK
jgi:hypothetical protein